MVIMATDMASTPRWKVNAFILLIANYSASLLAADLNLIPTLALDETFTDNVELTNTNKTSSFVSQIRAGLTSEYKSRLAELSLNANSIYVMYSHNHDLDDDFKDVNINGSYQLWPSGPRLVGRASIQNQSRNSIQNSLADLVSQDTVEYRDYSTGLTYAVSNSKFSINSSFAVNTTSAEDDIGEYDGISASLRAGNQIGNNFLWQLASNFTKRENNNLDGKTYQVEAFLGYAVTNYLSPFIRIYDEDSTGNISSNRVTSSKSIGPGIRVKISSRLYLDFAYNYVDDKKLTNDYFSGSIKWQPSNRTELNLELSQRFYGESYTFAFTHRNRKLTNNITYNEQIQAFDRNTYEQVLLGTFLCPIETNNSLDATACLLENNNNIDISQYQLVSLFDQQLVEGAAFSLIKTLQWQSQLSLTRTDFNLSIQNTERENLTTNRQDDTLSAQFDVVRKSSGKSDLRLSFSFQRQEFDRNEDLSNSQNDYYKTISTSYNRKLASSLSATFSLQYLDRNSTQINRSYEEARAILNIKKEF